MTDSSDSQTKDRDRLLYENGNNYRLHADNLRWALLGGYAALLAGLLSFSTPGKGDFSLTNPIISGFLFVLSLGYLMILAVQNWFYNFFAQYVNDCEKRLVKTEPLRSMQAYAKAASGGVTPFHPAFIFALLIVGLAAYYFLFLTIQNSEVLIITDFLKQIPKWLLTILTYLGPVIFLAFFNYLFMNWDKLMYKGFILRWSNLYNTVPEITPEPKPNNDSEDTKSTPSSKLPKVPPSQT